MIDDEQLKRQHPKYEQSAMENDSLVLGQITADAQGWKKSLIQTAMKGQLNLVIRDSHCEAGTVSETLKFMLYRHMNEKVFYLCTRNMKLKSPRRDIQRGRKFRSMINLTKLCRKQYEKLNVKNLLMKLPFPTCRDKFFIVTD